VRILNLLQAACPPLRRKLLACPKGMCKLSAAIKNYSGTFIDLGGESPFHCSPGVALNSSIFTGCDSPGIADYVAIFEHGRVYSECGFILVGEPDNPHLVEELSVARRYDTDWENHRFMAVFKHQVFHPVKKISGSVAVLTTTAANNNYYHFLLEALPRVELLRRAEITPDWYYIASGSGYQREMLQKLGIPLEKVIQPSDRVALHAEKLIIPAPRFHCAMDWGVNDFAGSGLDFIAKSFTAGAPDSGRKRLYIRRGNARTRWVVNEEQAVKMLESKFGFSCITPDEMTVKEQAAAFYQAELVVGMHGAGLSNIVFCRPDTAVIELFAGVSVAHYYNVLACKRQLKYYYAQLQAIDEINLYLDQEVLAQLINKVLPDLKQS
jgi:hypothetical protein